MGRNQHLINKLDTLEGTLKTKSCQVEAFRFVVDDGGQGSVLDDIPGELRSECEDGVKGFTYLSNEAVDYLDSLEPIDVDAECALLLPCCDSER